MRTRNCPIVLPILIGILLCPSFASGQEPAPDTLARSGAELEDYFSELLASRKFAALGACLIRGDSVVWEGYYGFADRERGTMLRPDNLFQLASLSKTVTATALMILHERKLFALDDDINAYMPIRVRNPNFPETPITFRMLLTHTAGFFDVLPNGVKISMSVDGDSKIPLRTYVEELFVPGGKYYSADFFGADKPGTKYRYSNIAFSLIGYLVEQLSKQDFSDFCRDHLFTPLEMVDTGWHLSDVDTSKVIYAYQLQPSVPPSYRKIAHFGTPGYPEGMLRTTLFDMAKFVSLFMNNGAWRGRRVLAPETVRLMLAPQQIRDVPGRTFRVIDMGLTWQIQEVEGTAMYSMNGFSSGIFTDAFFSEKEKKGFIFFFTGINMVNMPSMIGITKTLFHASASAAL